MILDRLENASRFRTLNKSFAEAFEFLSRPDLNQLPAGKIVIDGERLYASISKGPGRKKDEAKLETHEKYIDIQYVIAGVDEMGWKHKSLCRQPAAVYDPAADIRFFADEPETWFRVTSGTFVIFFPEDAHLPLISSGEVHKVVMKVRVEDR